MKQIIQISRILLLIFIFSVCFQPNIFADDKSNLIDQLHTASQGIKLPTETMIILEKIIEVNDFKLNDGAIQYLQKRVSPDNATKAIEVLPLVHHLQKSLNFENVKDDIITPYISNLNEIYGVMDNSNYFKMCVFIKNQSDLGFEESISTILIEMLKNSDTKEEVIKQFITLLPFKHASLNVRALASISTQISKERLLRLIDEIIKMNLDVHELKSDLENMKQNILHPERIPKWHVIAD